MGVGPVATGVVDHAFLHCWLAHNDHTANGRHEAPGRGPAEGTTTLRPNRSTKR